MARNYLVPGLTVEQRQDLEATGVSWCDFTDSGVEGTLFDEEAYARMLDKFNLRPVADSEKRGETAGIIIVQVEDKDTPPPLQVKKVSWSGENFPRFRDVIKELLLPVVNRDVCVHVPHGYTAPPIEDDNFHIHIWSSPKGGREKHPPATLWGIEVHNRDYGFLPTNQGISIIEPSRGWCAAELVGDANLYIHHDLVHYGTVEERDIFKQILKETVSLLTLSPEELAEKMRLEQEARKEARRQLYADICSQRNKLQLSSLEDALRKDARKIDELQQALTQALRVRQDHDQAFQRAHASQASEEEWCKKEFDNLLSVAKVVDVEMDSEKITIFTDNLYCTDPRTEIVHDIGAFRIVIYLTGSIYWYNTTRQVNGYLEQMHAPHVRSNGSACLGNMEEVFPDLIARYELSVAAQLAIEFVQSVNVTSPNEQWGPTIDKWPHAPAEMQKKGYKKKKEKKADESV